MLAPCALAAPAVLCMIHAYPLIDLAFLTLSLDFAFNCCLDTYAQSQPSVRAAARGAGRTPVYSEACLRCGTHVPQTDATAMVCDVPGCTAIACARCHPDRDVTLESAQHQGWVARIVGGDGRPITVTASVPVPPAPPVPDGASPHIAVLFAAVAVLIMTLTPRH